MVNDNQEGVAVGVDFAATTQTRKRRLQYVSLNHLLQDLRYIRPPLMKMINYKFSIAMTKLTFKPHFMESPSILDCNSVSFYNCRIIFVLPVIRERIETFSANSEQAT